MDHQKTFFKKIITTDHGQIRVEGPLQSAKLREYKFHCGLRAFREPDEQHAALVEISELPEGRIIAAVCDQTIVGYATFLYPDPLERWSEEKMENLLELGAIEVASEFRNLSLAKNILEVAMMDPYMENYIIFSTEYYWHWDLKNSGLDVWAYKDMMEKTMAAGGLQWLATDDPEITSHPANCLMVRFGKHVSLFSMEKSDRLRFRYRFMY